jgi:transcriptional regulator with XRE-family HTH domain
MDRLTYNIEKELMTCGWIQQDLADALGVHKQSLSRTLHGRNSPRLVLIERMAEELGVDVTDLLAPIPS